MAELTRDLRPITSLLEDDLRAAHDDMSPETITQAAIAWVLITVFIRFCEDNGLIDAPALSGPPDRLTLARERQVSFLSLYPDRTDRDWILAAFDGLFTSPATIVLFRDLHVTMTRFPISDLAARELIGFWRRVNEDGLPVHDFTDPDLDTEFLADLYAGFSESARKEYALIETPVWVADLILDHTLGPAVEEFGLAGLRAIDPFCGSGTFPLRIFSRLHSAWQQEAPAASPWSRVTRALESVHGIDKNPAAVAISRFRLLITAIRAAGATRLAEVPSLPVSIRCDDSLLTPDGEHGFDVVVANPPYITPKNLADKAAYRTRYAPYCGGTYALTVPAVIQLFRLARADCDQADGARAGYVGTLVSNSFMTREFGRPLVEQFLPTVDLTHILDTSGAYIPGHGAPTVLLLGRSRPPRTDTIRVIGGRRSEPEMPFAGESGVVWNAIAGQIDQPGSGSAWVNSSDEPRKRFTKHPWNLHGSADNDLLRAMDTGKLLGLAVKRIGPAAFTGANDAFLAPYRSFQSAEKKATRPVVTGTDVRDWTAIPENYSYFPDPNTDVESLRGHLRRLWPLRTILRRRKVTDRSPSQWDRWHLAAKPTLGHGRAIVFPAVATHPHFAILHGNAIPLQTAPVIELPANASDDDVYGLAGYLNSSTACFQIKAYSHEKGAPRGDQLRAEEPWNYVYEFTSAITRKLSVPSRLPTELGRRVDGLARDLIDLAPGNICEKATPTLERLTSARTDYEEIRHMLVAFQEEIDWTVYSQYGLIDGEGLVAPAPEEVPPVRPGERAFEIVMARQAEAGEIDTQWFARHGIAPVTDIPGRWSTEYWAIVARRIELIEQDRNIGLIERPEYKHRWHDEQWPKLEQQALREWLLDRCARPDLWSDGRPKTVSGLIDSLEQDPKAIHVARLLRGDDAASYGERTPLHSAVADILPDLVADEHVPFLAQYRYKDGGLAKHAAWEETWRLQREEDESGRSLDIPVPPQYSCADFRRPSYWRNRGKLDMPKERFISYPGAGPDDGSLLLGWAGWDDLQRADALCWIIGQREADGWDIERLVPLLAGLAEILPWARQWQSENDDDLFDLGRTYVHDVTLNHLLEKAGLTLEEVRQWKAPPVRRGRPPAKRSADADVLQRRR